MENFNKNKCEKVSYDTIEDADLRLNKIRSESNRKQKPLRSYQCQYCGKFHLTSKTKAEFNSNNSKRLNKIRDKNKKREERFIHVEANYWMKKLGIKPD